jgi:hypothetical protein
VSSSAGSDGGRLNGVDVGRFSVLEGSALAVADGIGVGSTGVADAGVAVVESAGVGKTKMVLVGAWVGGTVGEAISAGTWALGARVGKAARLNEYWAEARLAATIARTAAAATTSIVR